MFLIYWLFTWRKRERCWKEMKRDLAPGISIERLSAGFEKHGEGRSFAFSALNTDRGVIFL